MRTGCTCVASKRKLSCRRCLYFFSSVQRNLEPVPFSQIARATRRASPPPLPPPTRPHTRTHTHTPNMTEARAPLHTRTTIAGRATADEILVCVCVCVSRISFHVYFSRISFLPQRTTAAIAPAHTVAFCKIFSTRFIEQMEEKPQERFAVPSRP